MDCMPEPKPATTTLLTFLKILTEKGFVEAVKMGKGKLFSAKVSRRDYTSYYMRDVRDTFFGGSFRSLVSFFAEEENLSQQEIDDLLALLKKD
jgi:predicted transcriptional regulator